MNIIEVKDICKNYSVSQNKSSLAGVFTSIIKKEVKIIEALQGVTFSVKKGSICGVIGLNGAGKSTLIKILTGSLYPSSGECKVNSKIPYKDRESYVGRIGVVFGQRSQLLWDLPVHHSFDIIRYIYKVEPTKFKKNLEYYASLMGVDEYINTPVRMLSLGQRMRAEVVSTLLHDPDILFLDEPTIGLDVLAKSIIRKAISQLSKEKGTTVIITSHDLDDIDLLCDQLVVLDKGKIIHDGNKDDFIKQYRADKKIVVEIDEHSFDMENIESMFKEANIISSNRFSIEVNDSSSTIADILKRLASSIPLTDVSIEENSLEEIVHSLYD